MRSGFITLLGRPNVGKSTLLNRLVGRPVSIVSRRPQTTRFRILGIRTTEQAQFVYVDTPGLQGGRSGGLGVVMDRVARGAVEGVDVVVLVISARGWQAGDEAALRVAEAHRGPVILVINKVDQLKDKRALLPLIEHSRGRHAFAAIVPVSALNGSNLEALEHEVLAALPEAPAGFPAGQVTDRSEKFLAAELVREQLFEQLGAELPYVTAVELEKFAREGKLLDIGAVIWVEKQSQKGIVIGEGGKRLKAVGEAARKRMEELFGARVYLQLWVKVRQKWTRDDTALRDFGYMEE